MAAVAAGRSADSPLALVHGDGIGRIPIAIQHSLLLLLLLHSCQRNKLDSGGWAQRTVLVIFVQHKFIQTSVGEVDSNFLKFHSIYSTTNCGYYFSLHNTSLGATLLLWLANLLLLPPTNKLADDWEEVIGL